MSRLHFAQPVSKWPARILSAVTPSDGQPAREESHRQRVHCRHRIHRPEVPPAAACRASGP